MDPFYKDPKFKKLESKWYKKLKDKGFEDIEQDELRLKQYSGRVMGKELATKDKGGMDGSLTWDRVAENNTRSLAKEQYFRWARHMLNEWEFKNKNQFKVWEMHSEGMGVRPIAKKLKTYHTKIQLMIKNLREEMKACQKHTK